MLEQRLIELFYSFTLTELILHVHSAQAHTMRWFSDADLSHPWTFGILQRMSRLCCLLLDLLQLIETSENQSLRESQVSKNTKNVSRSFFHKLNRRKKNTIRKRSIYWPLWQKMTLVTIHKIILTVEVKCNVLSFRKVQFGNSPDEQFRRTAGSGKKRFLCLLLDI